MSEEHKQTDSLYEERINGFGDFLNPASLFLFLVLLFGGILAIDQGRIAVGLVGLLLLVGLVYVQLSFPPSIVLADSSGIDLNDGRTQVIKYRVYYRDIKDVRSCIYFGIGIPGIGQAKAKLAVYVSPNLGVSSLLDGFTPVHGSRGVLVTRMDGQRYIFPSSKPSVLGDVIREGMLLVSG